MFIMISIGQVVGWVATMYGETDHRRLGGHLIVATIGAFIGGYLSLWLISEYSKFSMIFSAFFVAFLLLITLRFSRSRECGRCGNTVSLVDKRCLKCGFAWPGLRSKNERKCRGCGATIPKSGAEYLLPGGRAKESVCPSCGKLDPSKFKWSDLNVRNQVPSIILTIILVIAVFLLLAWIKAREISVQGENV
jgi:uncharacterized membrane protein YeaQ/YmgE (transglycosylase-associated protein family)